MTLLNLILLCGLVVGPILLATTGAITHYPDAQRARRLAERRGNYRKLSPTERTAENVNQVCGIGGAYGSIDILESPDLCQLKLIGRPLDVAMDNCDKKCCTQGHLGGHCSGGNCHCFDDARTAFCGGDGRFVGIDCPIDNSACARYCCRRGYIDGGRCGGFLDFKCKCRGNRIDW